MFISTIIPTVSRPTLAIAVRSVLNQDNPGDTNEVIVVNDSGKPLPHEPWMDDDHVQVIHTQRNERSVARNTGAAVARGEYLHFLDDDDWMLEGAFARFWNAARRSNASFIYGGSQLMEDADKMIYAIHMRARGNCFAHMMAGEWIPTGSYIVKRDVFFKAGAFKPAMVVYEDFDFTRRVALEVDIDYIEEPVLCILRGRDWDTTTPTQHPSNPIRVISLTAREQILSHPAAFKRSLRSADTTYWRGHVLRTYVSSLIWNIKVRSYAKVFGRLAQVAALLVASGIHLLRPDYWKGLMRPHSSTVVRMPPAQQRV